MCSHQIQIMTQLAIQVNFVTYEISVWNKKQLTNEYKYIAKNQQKTKLK